MKKLFKALSSKKGSAHIEACVGLVILMMAFAFFMSFAPVFTAKFTLDNYANELIREAEIEGYIGASTTGARLDRLNEIKGLYPAVTWSKTGNVQLGQEITVTVIKVVTVHFMGTINFTVSSTASGRSEVYHK